MITNNLLPLFVAGVFAITCVSSAEDLQPLKQRFEEAFMVAALDAVNNVTVLQTQYLEALGNLLERFQKEGDLDAVKAVLRERERFVAEKTVPEEVTKESFSDIKELQRLYIEKESKLENGRLQYIESLIQKYDIQLASLQKTLTREGKIDEATTVQEERKRTAAVYLSERSSPLQDHRVAVDKAANKTAAVTDETSILYSAAKKLTNQSSRTDMNTWTSLPGKVVLVSGDPRKECDSDVVIKPGEMYLIMPCSLDRWNTSPRRWGDVDFRGHRGASESATNGLPFMQLCYSLDGGPLVPIVKQCIIDKPGRLLLAPSDREGGGSPENNTGSIRVKIVRVRR